MLRFSETVNIKNGETKVTDFGRAMEDIGKTALMKVTSPTQNLDQRKSIKEIPSSTVSNRNLLSQLLISPCL